MDEEELCLHGLELCDASLVFPQLVFMPAKLVGAGYVFVAVVLDSLQNCIELGVDFVDFPLHAIDASVLRGKASIHSLWKLLETRYRQRQSWWWSNGVDEAEA